MDEERLEKARRRLLEEIEAEAADTRNWTGRARFSDRVMAAMAKVPRHEFVLEEDRDYAYINRPRAIGFGQTISQPYIVAVMTDLLDLAGTDRVLEIGAGCGYQAAVLAEVVAKVYTVEVVETLANSARARLKRLGYDNVKVLWGDGFLGWPQKGPFDAIIVTSAPERVPEALLEQLRPGGRMVVPVGRVHETQTLYHIVKDRDGNLKTRKTLPVAFVPMVPKNEGAR